MNAVTDSYNFITIGKETIADRGIDKRVNWIFFLAYLECNAAVLRITNISMVKTFKFKQWKKFKRIPPGLVHTT